jgi:hypothetical protein
VPSRKRLKRLSCDNKRRYPTEKEARDTALHRQEESGDYTIWEYFCTFCGGWHIGHTPQPKRR